MAATKRVRWECPNGCAGVLGPSRPRRENICRYCLECSAKTGKLVERSVPSLDRKRQARAQTLAEKRAAKAKREYEKEWVVDGIDMLKLMKRYCKLPAFRPRGHRKLGAPKLVIVRHRWHPSSQLGRAWGGHEIRLNVSPDMSWHGVADTLIHELAHIWIARCGPSGVEPHGREWKDKYHEAIHQAFPGIEYKAGDAGTALWTTGDRVKSAIGVWPRERELDEPRPGTRVRPL